MKLLSVKKSTRKGKKLMAEFDDGTTTHFGAIKPDGQPYDDYTLKKDKDQRDRYRARHASGKNASAKTADALAYHLLWGESTSLQQNIKDYKKKYNV
jgi:hypothetical protein